MNIIRLISSIALALSFVNATAQTPAGTTSHPIELSQPVMQFIDQMVKEHHFNRNTLITSFRHASYNPSVIQKITFPYEKKPWDIYRSHFLTPTRIAGGAKYWKTHDTVLKAASKRYGIDPSVIVAIIGMETHYSSYKGTFSALNALSTLSFYYPPRETFFKRELAQLFLLAREQGIQADQIKSSYAGAIGIPQFMPSSYRHYAVSYQQGRPINLSTNNDDAIMSVANYLSQNGWKKGQPVTSPAIISGTVPTRLISSSGRPKQTLSQFKKAGIEPKMHLPGTTKAALIDLVKGDQQDEYWIVFNNFKAIMSYNPRTSYAMGVYQLSRAIREAYEKHAS